MYCAVTLSDRRDRSRGRRTRTDRAFRAVAGRVVCQAGVHRGRLLLDDVGRVPVTEHHRANHTADVLVRPDAQQDPLRSSTSLRAQIYRREGKGVGGRGDEGEKFISLQIGSVMVHRRRDGPAATRFSPFFPRFIPREPRESCPVILKLNRSERGRRRDSYATREESLDFINTHVSVIKVLR